jgi:outer membrane lipoprotein-sorting protein
MTRSNAKSVLMLAVSILAFVSNWTHAAPLKSVDAVLDQYKQALGGVDSIAKVQSVTVHGEIDGTAMAGKSSFVSFAKPFKTLTKITRADGSEATFGFDGGVSWSLDAKGASIDKDTALEAVRRDADLQYALHQPAYFTKLEFNGVTNFEGRSCYWLHGTTHWGKDNNQFYDVRTGLLQGYRFQADDSSGAIVVVLFEDYKRFGGPLVATRITSRNGDNRRTFTFKTVSYAPLADSVFDLPQAVKALL